MLTRCAKACSSPVRKLSSPAISLQFILGVCCVRCSQRSQKSTKPLILEV